MKNSLKKAPLALAVACLLTLISAAPSHAQCETQSTPLLAGQHIDSGTVSVTNDSVNLYVTYQTTSPWLLTQVHLAVADTVGGLPHNSKGNPVPGHFQSSATLASGVSTYTVTIPLTGDEVGTTIYIAAHAVVQSSGAGGSGGRETAWGFGPGFPGASNWATYFTYFVCGGGE